MAWDDEPQRERGRRDDALDDAIDRVVRDMTRVEAREDAVRRVMARVRGAGTESIAGKTVARQLRRRPRAVGAWAWSWTWAASAAALMIAVIVGYWMVGGRRGDDERAMRQAGNVPTRTAPAASTARPSIEGTQAEANPPQTSAAVPGAADARTGSATYRALTPRAQTSAPAPAGTLITQAMSLVEAADTADADTDNWRSDLLPAETDITVASITPVPMSAPIDLSDEPLGTRALVVESIDPNPIAIPPPVGPQR